MTDWQVPQWAEEFVQRWAQRLNLEHWEIRLRMALSVDGDEYCKALCEQYCDINLAIITIRADAGDEAEWRVSLLHEMLHVAHARVDNYVNNAAIPEMGEGQQDFARELYRQIYEPFVDRLSWSLYQLASPIDYPDEVG